MDYTKLKPGLYLQIGEHIKALDARAAWPSKGRATSLEKLAAQVAWLYTALDRRKEMINEIPYEWQVNGDEVKYNTAPFGFDLSRYAPRIDECLQLYSFAAILKQRNPTGEMIGVRWLDPTTIEPDDETVTIDGYQYFWRYTDSGQRQPLPASDVLFIYRPGMREMQPSSAAVYASSQAARVLQGINETSSTFFDNNGLPVMLVRVPDTTGDTDKDRVENRFKRLFNPRRGTDEIRAAAVSASIEVEKLSLTPSDLSMTDLTDSEIDRVLAVHGVRKSQVLGNAINRSVAVTDLRSMVATMGARLDFIASFINYDTDILATGYRLVVKTEQHSAMKRDEVESSAAFTNFLRGMYPDAAGYLLGINEENFPQEMQGRVFLDANNVATSDNGDTGNATAEIVVDDDGDDGESETIKGVALTNEQKDLARWKLKATKKVTAGKNAGFLFVSEYIEPVRNASIRAALSDANEADDVKAIFDDYWIGYP